MFNTNAQIKLTRKLIIASILIVVVIGGLILGLTGQLQGLVDLGSSILRGTGDLVSSIFSGGSGSGGSMDININLPDN